MISEERLKEDECRWSRGQTMDDGATDTLIKYRTEIRAQREKLEWFNKRCNWLDGEIERLKGELAGANATLIERVNDIERLKGELDKLDKEVREGYCPYEEENKALVAAVSELMWEERDTASAVHPRVWKCLGCSIEVVSEGEKDKAHKEDSDCRYARLVKGKCGERLEIDNARLREALEQIKIISTGRNVSYSDIDRITEIAQKELNNSKENLNGKS